MPKNLLLAASLPAPPEKLYDMYLDPAIHAAFTGAPVTIEPRPALRFARSKAHCPVRSFTSNPSG